MKKEKKIENKSKKIKLILILLSILIVIISLSGDIIVTNKGNLGLIMFYSFYAYVIAIVIALYQTIKNKNPNANIFIALLTYAWTYYTFYQGDIENPVLEMKLGLGFYIYLSSSIFLIIALFFNDEEQTNDNSNPQNENNDLSNKFIFTSFISGIKGIPLNTTVLLVNDSPENSINLVYNLGNNDKDGQTIKIPISTIKNISFASKLKMQNIEKKVEDNEVRQSHKKLY